MGFIKCYAEKVDKWGRKCNIHLWDDEEGYNIYICDNPKCKEEFSEPLEDYEFEEKMKEAYLEDKMEERRLGL